MQKILEGKGQGKIIYEKFEVKSTFSIEFYIGEQAILFFDLGMFSKEREKIRKNDEKECRFVGQLEDGSKITIDKLILISEGDIDKGVQKPIKYKVFSSVKINRKDFDNSSDEKILFTLSNLEFNGCEKTLSAFSGWSLDHFTLNIEGYSMELRHNKDYKKTIKQLKKKTISKAITSELIVNCKLEEKQKILEIVNDLCMLMSFAKGNSIVPYGEIHFRKDKICYQEYRSYNIEDFRSGDFLIHDIPFEEIQKFIEQSYPNYKKYKKDLGLNVILRYYELMKRNPILDVRCVLGFILLECIANFAQEYYEKSSNPIEGSLRKTQVNKLSKILLNNQEIAEEKIKELEKERLIYPFPTLKDSIDRLMKEFNMEYKTGEHEIYALRKEFIHKGIFPKDKEPLKVFYKLVHFIDRLILSILEYKGEYIDISNGYRPLKIATIK